MFNFAMDMNFLYYVITIFVALTATAMVRDDDDEDTIEYDYEKGEGAGDIETHEYKGGNVAGYLTNTPPKQSGANTFAGVRGPSTSHLRQRPLAAIPSTSASREDPHAEGTAPRGKPAPADRPFVDTDGDEITITRPEGVSDEAWHELKNTLCQLIQKESLARRQFLTNMLHKCPREKGLAYSLRGYDESILVVGDDMYVLQFRRPVGMKKGAWDNIKYYAKPLFNDAVLKALPGMSWSF